MSRLCLFVLFCFFTSSCDYYMIKTHEENVGFIEKSKAIGPKDFKACFEEKIFSENYGRKRAEYKPGFDKLRQYIFSQYDNYGFTNESGYITFRFIINCDGQAGRYEIHQVGMDFKKKIFNKELVEHLFELVSKLQNWTPMQFYDDKYDSFFHLTFKINNGELLEVLY